MKLSIFSLYQKFWSTLILFGLIRWMGVGTIIVPGRQYVPDKEEEPGDQGG